MTTKAPARSAPRKTATPRKTAAAAKKPAGALPVQDVPAAPALPELKRQELLTKVVERAEVKKKFAKPVLEAALEVIGEALAQGRDLNLAPLGKLKINRVREQGGARVVIARIRQGAGGAGGAAKEDDEEMKEVVADLQE